jgi:hypothetical protein
VLVGVDLVGELPVGLARLVVVAPLAKQIKDRGLVDLQALLFPCGWRVAEGLGEAVRKAHANELRQFLWRAKRHDN